MRLRARGSAAGVERERDKRETCQRALTRKRTLWSGGVLQVCDLRLAEDGSECSSTLVFDEVVVETASEGGSQRAGAYQRSLTRKRILWGGGALEVGDIRLYEDGSEREGALGPKLVHPKTARDG